MYWPNSYLQHIGMGSSVYRQESCTSRKGIRRFTKFGHHVLYSLVRVRLCHHPSTGEASLVPCPSLGWVACSELVSMLFLLSYTERQLRSKYRQD